jgi:aminopeptidase YwaD
MAGRGYVNNGVNRAADFLTSEYNRIGLTPILQGTYKQPFSFPVNSFPDQQKVTLNGKQLLVGIDFLINESSGAGKGFGEILFSSDNYTSGKGAKKNHLPIFILDEKRVANKDSLISIIAQNQPVVFLTEKKLTWSTSTQAYPYPVVYLKRNLIGNKNAILSIDIKNKWNPSFECNNVIGAIEGAIKDTFIVLTAHYDHLGMMGKTALFPGANDNASGTAMLIDFAHYYKNHPSKYSMVFIAFAGEEAGLIGSKYFTENSPIDLSKIKFLVNMDLMGSGKDGVTIVNGTIFSKEFNQLININLEKKYVPEVKVRGEAANSDHYWFSKKGVPSFFIYTLGEITAYHDVNDVPSKLPLTKYNQVFSLIRDFISGF